MDWQYYGLFLPEEERVKLLNFLFDSDWDYLFEETSKVYLDHCTLLHFTHYKVDKDLASSIEKRLEKLKEVSLIVTYIGYSDKALAFKVSHLYPIVLDRLCFNKVPHITIGTYGVGKPVDSNYITEWFSIEPIEIKTYLKRI